MVNRRKKAPTSSASSSQSETDDDWVVPKKGVDWKGPFLLLGLAPILLGVWMSDKLAQSISQRFGQDEPLLAHCPPGFDDLPLDPFIDRYLYEGKGKQPPFNVTEFLKTFRHHPGYDAYQESYTERKAMTRHYKKWISSNVKPGDKIFESAAGIGLNLFMALEVIQEETGISDITVYGNEYLEKSAQRANILLDALLDDTNGIMKGNHFGKICPGDSTNLTYIPPESFDLVFTGYLSPILDPLDTGRKYRVLQRELCAAPKDDWKAQKLLDIIKQKQEDWYSKWVQEMIRIAKPGAPVIVEQIPVVYCDEVEDNGGVHKEYWPRAVKVYHWDIDPASIEFKDDTQFDQRYHVFMRKNGKKE